LIKESYLKIGIVVLAVCLLLIAVVGIYYHHQKAIEASKTGYFAIDWYWAEYEELVSKSDLIVVAKVTNERGIWGTSDGKKPSSLDYHLRMIGIYRPSDDDGIKTEYTFEPVTVLKGNVSDFKGHIYGGTVDGYSSTGDNRYSSFKIGDHVLLFLLANHKEDGTSIDWYYIGDPQVFTDNGDGTFSNVYYGTVTVDQVKNDIDKLEPEPETNTPIVPESETDILIPLGPEQEPAPAKPVIYLYPNEPTDITVYLNYDGVLDFTYPAYHDGWTVTAYPNGTLINHRDGKEYSYLFWEGHGEADYDLSKGFIVKGEDTVDFLQEKLSYMGLTPREYNEFIVYWLPQMQNNKYNFITFQGEAYTDTAELVITPAPDSVLRVFMAYMPLDEPIEIEEQTLSPFTRTGFTVIEWGGCILNE